MPVLKGDFPRLMTATICMRPMSLSYEKIRMPDPIPQTFAGFMPDLAVEIASPSNSSRANFMKKRLDLLSATGRSWFGFVYPERESAEVCRVDDEEQLRTETIGIDGELSGEDVLPGFALALRQLFGGEGAKVL